MSDPIDNAADDYVQQGIVSDLSHVLTVLSDVFDANIPTEKSDYVPGIARQLAEKFSKHQIEHLMDIVNETLCIIDGE